MYETDGKTIISTSRYFNKVGWSEKLIFPRDTFKWPNVLLLRWQYDKGYELVQIEWSIRGVFQGEEEASLFVSLRIAIERIIWQMDAIEAEEEEELEERAHHLT